MNEQLIDADLNLASRISRLFQTLPCDIRNSLINIRLTVEKDTCLKILILLTITGLMLRLWHIGDISFWLDETLTNYYSHQSFLGIWHIGTDGVNPPTFYWIEHVMLYFGSGETILRLVPALVGTCTIPVFYLLGREFSNRETGIVAATLITFSAFHIYYSQEARPYTLLLFCFSLALLFYIKALRTDTGSAWLLFGFFSALACWIHFFGFVMVLPLFILALFFKFSTGKTSIIDLKPVILAGAIWFLLSLPMLIVTVQAGISKVTQAETWGIVGIDVITTTIRAELGPSWEMLILGLLFLLGLVQILRNDRKQFFFIVVALALPLVITVALSYRMAIVPRYLIGLLPFFFLVISYFISSIHSRIFTIRFSCVAILILIIISVPSLNLYYSSASKSGEDWKGFALKLHNMTGNEDVILIYPWFYTTPFNYYYNNRKDNTFVYGIKNKTDLEVRTQQNREKNKFLIFVDLKNRDSSGNIGQWIKTHTVLIENDEELYLYRIQNL